LGERKLPLVVQAPVAGAKRKHGNVLLDLKEFVIGVCKFLRHDGDGPVSAPLVADRLRAGE